VYYGIEARAYAALMFFSAASALALLTAVRTGQVRWWGPYAASVAAVLYTHYTGVGVIAAEGAWALWYGARRGGRCSRPIAAAAGAYAPWLPYVQAAPEHFRSIARLRGPWALGTRCSSSWQGLRRARRLDVPGTVPLVLLGCGAGRRARGPGRGTVPSRGRQSSPSRPDPGARTAPGRSFCRVSGLVGDDLFLFPRSMSASLPFVGLALGWVLVRPARPWAIAAVVLAAGASGSARRRPSAPKRIARTSPAWRACSTSACVPRDVVLYYGPALDPFVCWPDGVPVLRRSHRVAGANPGEASRMACVRSAPWPRTHLPLSKSRRAAGLRPPSVAGWEAVDHRDLPGLRALTTGDV
jgi:hypothetical protein